MLLDEFFISIQENYNHLGVTIDHKCMITEACNKGHKSYHALSDPGLRFLNPKTLSH